MAINGSVIKLTAQEEVALELCASQTAFFLWFAQSGWLFRFMIFATWVLPFVAALVIGVVTYNFVIQEKPPTLQAILSGETILSSSSWESHRQGHRQRALAILHQMIEDAHMGKRQFLSGKLYNLARALADEDIDANFMKGANVSADQNVIPILDRDGVLGLGLRATKPKSFRSAAGETSVHSVGYDMKDTGKRLYGPLSSKPVTYLSAFILYIATIG